MEIISGIIFSYLCGTIPFGLLLAKIFGLGDIRNIGSGNIGATNVLRTGSKKIAAFTLFLDMLKGLIPLIILRKFGFDNNELFICAIAAIIGHIFPVWLKFKGGKGVATATGVLLGVIPAIGITYMLIWTMSFMTTKISSLSSIAAYIMSTIFAFGLFGVEAGIYTLIISAIVVAKHKSNIQRLLKGEEKPFSSKAT